jgi:hypothetical protein
MEETSAGVTSRVSFEGDRFTWNGLSWPLRGAHATVTDKRSGLAHRKHIITLVITSGDARVMTWRAQRTGAAAADLYRPWSAFAANLNHAAAAEDPASGGSTAG